jgi:DNA replication protein DnaC
LRIRATYNVNHIEGIWHEKEKDVFDSLETVPLLLFDDVGKEQPQDSRFTQRVYYNVIDGRYHRDLPMVLTSNLDMAELAGYIGEASVDRLVEMAKGQIVEMRGESYRKRAG